MRRKPLGNTIAVAAAFFFYEGSRSFLFHSLCFLRGGDSLYITWEQLLLFGAFIVALLQYVRDHYKKK